MIVMAGSMISSFAATILLGRSLSLNDFGEFALLKQILLIGFTVAVFGLDHGYIKYFSRNHRNNRRIHFLTFSIIIGISLLYVFGISILYPFQSKKLFFISISVCFGALNLYLAARSRVEEKFFWGQLLHSGWKIIFLVSIVFMPMFNNASPMNYVYISIPISLIVFSIIFIRILFQGSDPISDNVDIGHYLKLGLIFWLINSTGLISGGIEKMVIPLIYDSETLGIFTGSSFLFIISLTMIGSAIGYVIFPQISSGKSVNLRKVFFWILMITIFSTLLFSQFGESIVKILFTGRFDEYIDSQLIILFTIIGSLNIIHTILHFLLSAHADKKQLLIYWIITLANIVFFVLVLLMMKGTSFSLLTDISLTIILARSVKIVSILVLLKKVKNDKDGFLKVAPEAA